MQSLDLGPLWLSFQLGLVTVVVLLLLATPLAWWLAFTRSRIRVPIEATVALPLVLPPTVLGFYLLIFLGPGLIGWALHQKGLIALPMHTVNGVETINGDTVFPTLVSTLLPTCFP